MLRHRWVLNRRSRSCCWGGRGGGGVIDLLYCDVGVEKSASESAREEEDAAMKLV